MKILSTSHTHTQYVDGKSTAEQMVLAAISKGFQSIGFSEHARQSVDLKYGLTQISELEYITEIKRLREVYGDRIRIWLGCERDAFSVANRLLYEYVIGSSHYFARGDEWYAVDGSLQDVQRCYDTFFGGNGVKMARAYYEQLAGYIEEFSPDIIGHLDVIRKQNDGDRFFDTQGHAYRDIVFQAMERMIHSCDMLEVNTGGMARGYVTTPYPQPFILTRWREMGGRVIASSDCHDARFIDHGYEFVEELLKEAGYKTAFALGSGKQLFEEYDL